MTKEKKSMASITQVKNNKVELMEPPETNRLMTIFTKSGNVQLIGPVEELIKFKKQIKDKENRHTFLEFPLHLITYNPALESVTVLPADVGIIIIADPTKAPQRSNILAPVAAIPKKLN